MSIEMRNSETKVTVNPLQAPPKKAGHKVVDIGKRHEIDIAIELIRNHRNDEFWQRYCGYLDLSLAQIMKIQKDLLLEQIEYLKNSEMGRAVMKGAMPRTVEEFRAQVPFTSYKDYAPFLLKQREETLPSKTLLWGHTSGRTGEYDFKWCPINSRQWEEVEKMVCSVFNMCTVDKKGDVNINLHDKALYGSAPPPYITGLISRYGMARIFDFIPELDDAETLPFAERFKRGISTALAEGLDIYMALPSVLVNTAERFGQNSRKPNIKGMLQRPKMIPRILRGVIRSKMAHRPMLPKDVWDIKGIVAAGSDSAVYRDKIEEYWGRRPVEALACTEGMIIASQTWDCEGMTFYPTYNFFEFIPEDEVFRSNNDPGYRPTAYLLDQVKAGQNYQLVITNFFGGAFVRYKVGDMVKITALRNDKLNIDIPQMRYHSRVDDMIDIAGFTRLTETVVWKAIENSGVPYEDWAIRKELREKPILHLYLEPKEGFELDARKVTEMIHDQLAILDKPYGELEKYVGLKPLEVTLLPKGAFYRYFMKQMAAGVEVGRLKVSHVNPSNETVNFLMNVTPSAAPPATVKPVKS